MPDFFFPLLFMSTVSASIAVAVDGAGKSIVPSFTLHELLSNKRAEQFATILGTTGILTIETPSFNDVLRHAALDGICRCENHFLLKVENSDTAILDDGTTVRTTIATGTAGINPRPLPANLADYCGHDTAVAMERIRDEVAVAADAFIRALDVLIGNTNDNSGSVLDDSKGRSYGRIASIVAAANHLEHFHVYSKKTASDAEQPSLHWHTDAGLFLAFVPAFDCQRSAAADNYHDASFLYKDENGISTRAVFQPNSIAIMLGAGAEYWLQSPVSLKATSHAVTMKEGDARAWYGMSKCHPMKQFPNVRSIFPV